MITTLGFRPFRPFLFFDLRTILSSVVRGLDPLVLGSVAGSGG